MNSQKTLAAFAFLAVLFVVLLTFTSYRNQKISDGKIDLPITKIQWLSFEKGIKSNSQLGYRVLSDVLQKNAHMTLWERPWMPDNRPPERLNPANTSLLVINPNSTASDFSLSEFENYLNAGGMAFFAMPKPPDWLTPFKSFWQLCGIEFPLPTASKDDEPTPALPWEMPPRPIQVSEQSFLDRSKIYALRWSDEYVSRIKWGSACHTTVHASTPDGKPLLVEIRTRASSRGSVWLLLAMFPGFNGDGVELNFKSPLDQALSANPPDGQTQPRSPVVPQDPEGRKAGFEFLRQVVALLSTREHFIYHMGLAGDSGFSPMVEFAHTGSLHAFLAFSMFLTLGSLLFVRSNPTSSQLKELKMRQRLATEKWEEVWSQETLPQPSLYNKNAHLAFLKFGLSKTRNRLKNWMQKRRP